MFKPKIPTPVFDPAKAQASAEQARLLRMAILARAQGRSSLIHSSPLLRRPEGQIPGPVSSGGA